MTFNKSQLTRALYTRFKKDKVPSVALQASINKTKVFESFYGSSSESTLYGVASLTKSVTAVGIMKLQDDEKLLVTDLVKEWLPELKLPKAFKNKITIHHLLTHTAGFPGMNAFNLARVESLERDPDAEHLFGAFPQYDKQVVSVIDMIEAMNNIDYEFIAEPGSLFNYSNEGYALLEEIIKRASKRSYIDYINETIFKPLEMSNSVFTVEELDNYQEVARPYASTKDKTRKVFYSPTWWESGEIYGAGTLKSTTADLLRYLEIFNRDKILSKQAVETMTTTHIKTPNENQYGYGLLVGEFAGKKVVGHGGGVKGVSSYMLVCRELDFTAVALTNIAEVAAEDYLLLSFSLITETDISIPINKSAELPNMDQYVGEYASSEGNKINVSQLNDKNLTLKIDHITLEVEYEKDSIFILPNGKKIAFVNQDGVVTGLFRGMRYLEKKS